MIDLKEIMNSYHGTTQGNWVGMGPKVVAKQDEDESVFIVVTAAPDPHSPDSLENMSFISLMHRVVPEICRELDILRGSIEKYKGLASCVLSGASVEECIETGMCVECPFSSNDEACYEITKKGVS